MPNKENNRILIVVTSLLLLAIIVIGIVTASSYRKKVKQQSEIAGVTSTSNEENTYGYSELSNNDSFSSVTYEESVSSESDQYEISGTTYAELDVIEPETTKNTVTEIFTSKVTTTKRATSITTTKEITTKPTTAKEQWEKYNGSEWLSDNTEAYWVSVSNIDSDRISFDFRNTRGSYCTDNVGEFLRSDFTGITGYAVSDGVYKFDGYYQDHRGESYRLSGKVTVSNNSLTIVFNNIEDSSGYNTCTMTENSSIVCSKR